jgi:hypothetical protein
MNAPTPIVPHTEATRAASWGSVERAWLENHLAPHRARMAAMSPAHRASYEEHSRANDEAYESYLDGQDASRPDREDAFKRGLYGERGL